VLGDGGRLELVVELDWQVPDRHGGSPSVVAAAPVVEGPTSREPARRAGAATATAGPSVGVLLGLVVRPSGTVTFLFTDIEGSTRRWEADPEGMRSALAAHDEVLRSAVEAGGGWLFKHTGDGVCVAFASARDAVVAAVDAQRRLGLPVRMGLASGVAELRGDDYFGAPLNRTAPVMAVGHGGQVLVVASTSALLCI
jgi:class 3 adenylate cyclase